jgi:uncharacterized protein
LRWRLVVMAKEPVAGRVKTRLARELGVGAATRFARHAIRTLLQRVSGDARWQTTLAVAPDAALGVRVWPPAIARLAQGRGDLGHRMQRIMNRLPPGPVVIVGTDVPGIAPEPIAAAFRLLGHNDAVFGPAVDGGYWLIGLRRRPRVLRAFGGVRWSTVHALADTLANLEGLKVGRVRALADVDDAAALASAAPLIGRRVLPSQVTRHDLAVIQA